MSEKYTLPAKYEKPSPKPTQGRASRPDRTNLERASHKADRPHASERSKRRGGAVLITAGLTVGAIVGPAVQGFLAKSRGPAPVEQYAPDTKGFKPADFGVVYASSDVHEPNQIASEFLREHGVEGDVRPYADEISRQAGGAGNVQVGEEFHLPLPDHK